MNRPTARASRTLALAALLAFPLATAQAATLSQAQADCRARVDAHNAAVNAFYENRALSGSDTYQNQTAKKLVPTSKSGSGSTAQNFSCYDITNDAFNDILQDAGSLFGDYSGIFTSIFGGVASSQAGSLCQQAQQATGALFNQMSVNCPQIYVPGMPVNCSASVGLGSGGITYSGSGALGGLSGNTSGTYTGGTVPYPAKAPANGGAVSKFSCWLSNSCGQ